MKKSGILPATGAVPAGACVGLLPTPAPSGAPLLWGDSRSGADGSGEAVIAPEAYEITAEVVTEGHDLRREAPAQLAHELLIGRVALAIDQTTPHLPPDLAPQPGRDQAFERLQRRPGYRVDPRVPVGPRELVQVLEANCGQ